MRKPLLMGSIFLVALVFFLHQVFLGNIILAQFFNLGPIKVHYYGVIMALAVASGFYLAIKRSQTYNITKARAEDLILWLVVGGFIGARLYHVLSLAPFYYSHPADIIKVWNGGLSIYGAVLGGLATLWVYRRLLTWHLALSTLLDWLTPSLLLGQIIGRFGNLFNYEVFGYPTNLPWKMFVPIQFRPGQFEQFQFFHPWFLYEQLGLCLIIFIIYRRNKTQKSNLFLWYVLLYNILRFGLEFLRIDSTFIGNFRLNVISSAIFVLVSLVGLAIIYVNKNAKKT